MNKADIEKGLAALRKSVEDGQANRRDVLLLKAQNNTITKEENEELVKSLAGGSLAREATAGLTQNATIAKSLDAGTDGTDFLKEFLKGNVAGLEKLSDRLEKGEVNDHAFRKALAQTLLPMAEVQKSLLAAVEALPEMLVKALNDGAAAAAMAKSQTTVQTQNGAVQVPAIGSEARGPRAVLPNGQAQPLNKAFPASDGTPAGTTQVRDAEEVAKSLIAYAEHLVEKGGANMGAGGEGDMGVRAKNGESIAVAVSTLEQHGYVSKSLLDELDSFSKSMSVSAH